MSYFEDYVQDGLCCEGCGEFLGGAEPGFVRRCSVCERAASLEKRREDRQSSLPRFNRYAIPDPKIQKAGDPIRQGDTMACPFCVKRVKVAGFGDHMLSQHQDKWQ